MKPTVHLIGQAPKDNHIVRRTILYSPRLDQDVFDDQNYIQCLPLPEDSPDYGDFRSLFVQLREKLDRAKVD